MAKLFDDILGPVPDKPVSPFYEDVIGPEEKSGLFDDILGPIHVQQRQAEATDRMLHGPAPRYRTNTLKSGITLPGMFLKPSESIPPTPPPDFGEQQPFQEYAPVPSDIVDRHLDGLHKDRNKAANIVAMAAFSGLPESTVNDHYDDMNTLKDQPEAYKFLPGLAMTGGMLMAPVFAAGSTVPLWKYLLGAAAFGAEEEANRYVRSQVQGTKWDETKPWSMVDLAPPDASDLTKTVLNVADIFAKGKTIHVGYSGLEPQWQTLTRDTLVQQGLPTRIYVEPNLASDIMRGVATQDQQQTWRDLGITPEELRDAKHGGFQLEIPAERLITIADKPWYAQLKQAFNISPYAETTVEPGGPRKVVPVAGLLGEGEAPAAEAPSAGKPPSPEAPKGPVAPAAPAPEVKPVPSSVPARYQGMFDSVVNQTGVPGDLLAKVVWAESGWNPGAVSPVGAGGLTQLMPGTARDMGVIDRTDPYDNLKGGAKYLKQMVDRYNGDQQRALVAYNWGPGNADKWNGNPDSLPKETRDYVDRILGAQKGTRDQFVEQVKADTTLKPEESEAMVQDADTIAETWARINKATPEEWWGLHVQDAIDEGTAPYDILQEIQAKYGVPSEIDKLTQLANESETWDDFKKKVRQGNLMDLSSPELHRFGRAVPVYADEPYEDIQHIVENIPSYVEDIKYTNKATYQQVTGKSDTVTAYRAVPKEFADQGIRPGDYVSLDKEYAKLHGRGKEGKDFVVLKEKLPKKDVVWGQADFNEWAYSPRELREQTGSLEEFYNKVKGKEVPPALNAQDEAQRGSELEKWCIDRETGQPRRMGMNDFSIKEPK